MSTRRPRIRAVATLPTRRKVQKEQDNENSTEETVPVKPSEPETSIAPQKLTTPAKTASPSHLKDVPQRRRTVKPTINIMAANRKIKPQDKSPEKVAPKESPSRSVELASVSVSPNRKPSANIATSIILSPKNNQTSEVNDGLLVSPKSNINVIGLSPSRDVILNSEPLNDDVSFDPIIPLPSSSKTNRPKLKPPPRFALRRNSFQGSASEAEETDAPPSPPPANSFSASSATPVLTLSAPIATPSGVVRIRLTSTSVGPVQQQHKPKPTSRYKVADIPHQARTMKDLIFYNPPNNAIQPKNDELKREVCPIPPTPEVVPEPNDNTETETEESEAMPVPQVKLGPNGEIVIDEQSLVIETSEALRSRQRLQQLSVVWDGGAGSGGGKYMRGKRCREWTHRETLRFYRALHTMGTDFSLMLSLFPGRSRKDLKTKFKKEERQNCQLVNKVLMNPLQFNMDELEQDAILDMEEEEKEKQKVKEIAESNKQKSAQKRKKSSSLAAQSIGEECLTAFPAKTTVAKNKVPNKKLRSDNIAKDMILPSPARSLIPPYLEQGSLVLLQEKDGLKAYLAGGESLKPLPLTQDALQRIASKLGQNISLQTP